jgi:tetratricopeptide (TPR) repeat protein
MTGHAYDDFFNEGIAVLKKGYTNQAMKCFEKAYALERAPIIVSHLGYCRAYVLCRYQEGITMCREAIENEPNNPVHYLNLGRIFLTQQKKKDAIEAFRKALDLRPDDAVMAELDRLGCRKPPVFPFLSRRNPLNKYIGLVLSRFGLR